MRILFLVSSFVTLQIKEKKKEKKKEKILENDLLGAKPSTQWLSFSMDF
jgi:hypothetical protein